MPNFLNILKNLFYEADTNQLISKYQDKKEVEKMRSIFTILDGLDSWNETKGGTDNIKNQNDGKIDFLSLDLEFNIRNYLLDKNGDFSQEKIHKIFGETINVADVKKALKEAFNLSKKTQKENEKNEYETKNEKFQEIPKKVRQHITSQDEVQIIKKNGEKYYKVNLESKGNNFYTYNKNGEIVELLEIDITNGMEVNQTFLENGEKGNGLNGSIIESYKHKNGLVETYDHTVNSLSRTFIKNEFLYDFTSENNVYQEKLKNIVINKNLVNQVELSVIYNENNEVIDFKNSSDVINFPPKTKQDLITMLNNSAKLGDDFELIIEENTIKINPLIRNQENDYVELTDELKQDCINLLKKGLHCNKDFEYLELTECDQFICPKSLLDKAREREINSNYIKFINSSKTNDILRFIEDNPKCEMLGRHISMQTVTIGLDDKEFVFDINDGLIEEISKEKDENSGQIKLTVNNFRNNIKQIVYLNGNKYVERKKRLNIATNMITNYCDSNGKLIHSQTMQQSSLIAFPTITTKDVNGKITTNQYASYDSDNKTIQRQFVSYDGTKSEYYFEKTNDGIEILNYKITDNSGKILLDRKNAFQQISKNKFLSSINENIYEIEFIGEEIHILDKTNNKKYIVDLDGKILEGKEKVFDILKNVPGNQLIMMLSKKLDYINCSHSADQDSIWLADEHEIYLKKYNEYSTTEVERLTAAYMHEFGHFLDSDSKDSRKHIISTNPDIVNIFKEELENLKYCTTSIEQDCLFHIIEDSESEIVAETNMLLHTEEPGNGTRTTLFMQHFPRTIAKIAEILEEEESKFLAQ